MRKGPKIDWTPKFNSDSEKQYNLSTDTQLAAVGTVTAQMLTLTVMAQVTTCATNTTAEYLTILLKIYTFNYTFFF